MTLDRLHGETWLESVLRQRDEADRWRHESLRERDEARADVRRLLAMLRAHVEPRDKWIHRDSRTRALLAELTAKYPEEAR